MLITIIIERYFDSYLYMCEAVIDQRMDLKLLCLPASVWKKTIYRF